MKVLSKEKRLKELEESLESGILEDYEYEKQKREIEESKEAKVEVKEEKVDVQDKKGDKILVFLVLGVILIFIVAFSFRFFTDKEPKSIEELHLLNLDGKLKPDQGYLYNDVYSFIKFDDLWYIQLQSPKKTRFYNLALRYDPKNLENISIGGRLNTELFDDAEEYYVTFNPKGRDFSHISLGVGDFNQHMVNVFFKNPIAACDRNETFACEVRPIITCDNTDKVVLYMKEANDTNVYYDGNCIVVEARGFEFVRGIDRVLLNLYGIMEQ